MDKQFIVRKIQKCAVYMELMADKYLYKEITC